MVNSKEVVDMAQRKIIRIDEEKCDGCGQCVSGCAEGALAVIDGKARLVSDVYCDGLGACLGECPTGALEIMEREAAGFDEAAVEQHLAQPKAAPLEPLACGCPGSLAREPAPRPAPRIQAGDQVPASTLGNWPLQLHLVPVKAPFFQDKPLLIAADCAGFSLTNLHRDFLPGRALIIACPKLDETGPYLDKLAAIFRENHTPEITVVYMTVPCCFGLVHLIKEAVGKSGRAVPVGLVKVDPEGRVVEDVNIPAA
ncbi:MAG: 4Fe-4S binding protein [Pseudomonadota bacterium]